MTVVETSPAHRARQRRTLVRRRLSGIAFLLIPPLLIWLSIAIYDKSFEHPMVIYIRASTVGNQLHAGADVKLRGVVVGQVRSVHADGLGGATLKLAINRGDAKYIPSDVDAQFLPTTVFGERYVDLAVPQGAPQTQRAITAGATIGEDRSADAIEIQQVLRDTLKVLTDLRPAEISATLTAMATALQGQGDSLGTSLVELDGYLKAFNPHVRQFAQNLHQLAIFADNVNGAAPDLLDALRDFATTTGTLAQKRQQLADLYTKVGGSSTDLSTFLRGNYDNLIELPHNSVPVLDTLARYSPEIPCSLKELVAFIPLMDLTLGKGTDKQGAHATIITVPSKGRYVPGKDDPRYDKDAGPRCYIASPGHPYSPQSYTIPVLNNVLGAGR